MVVRGKKRHPLKGASWRRTRGDVGKKTKEAEPPPATDTAASISFYPGHHYSRVSVPANRTFTGVPSKLSHLKGAPLPHNTRAIKNTRLSNSSAVDCEGSPPSHKSEQSSPGEPPSLWIDPPSNEHLSTIETNFRDPDD
ncbi:unnamed protein product [Brassica napus]|uniref:(rape) hypothetical protein n=1 Tax=Brassica napus TaxID=3708 RepID=A0A816IVF4_BRANA|nr:unnamed protein product [Brassica napus]